MKFKKLRSDGSYSSDHGMICAYSTHGYECKERFLRDAAALLREAGKHLSRRGLTRSDVRINRAGMAVSDATDEALRDLQVYHTQNNLWESVAPGTHEALAEIRSRGLAIIVVSNANGRLHALLDRLDLARYFDVVVDSSLEQVEKPDPRLFQIAMGRAGAAPERTLHVGDLYHVDVAGARAAGMHPLLIDTADLYRDADCPRVRAISAVPSFIFDDSRPSPRPAA